ncbi:MAG: Lcl domain-containing protein [Methylovulum sp.]
MIGLKQTAIAIFWAGLIIGNAAQAADDLYKPGDIGPLGGKVYYVDDSGKHGLEVKTADELNSLTWSDAVTAVSAYGSGWRLPAKSELKALYEQKDVIGGFAKDDYWSATELDSNSAWIQGFAVGDQDRYNKYSKLRVRAVRAF